MLIGIAIGLVVGLVVGVLFGRHNPKISNEVEKIATEIKNKV